MCIYIYIYISVYHDISTSMITIIIIMMIIIIIIMIIISIIICRICSMSFPRVWNSALNGVRDRVWNAWRLADPLYLKYANPILARGHISVEDNH